jgi:hypothetical protein
MAYGDTALTTQPAGYVQDALNKPFAFSNTQAALNPGQLQQQAADTAYQSATRYLDPQFQRQQSGLESQLANQGITRGSEAWNNATNQFNENKNQAYDQARSQAYTQGLGGANQALNTMFQQSSLDTAKQNAQTMADAMKTQGMYGLGAGLLGSSTGQTGVGNLLKGAGSGLGSVLGGLGGLFGSGGGSLDSLVGGADMAKLIGLDGSSSAGGGLLSSLGGLFGSGGSSVAGMDPEIAALIGLDKATGGGIGKTAGNLLSGAGNAVSDVFSGVSDFFSDRAMKQNIEKIGKLDNGLNLYKWDYKPEFKELAGYGTHTGVMADEAEKIMPHAVKMHSSGHKMVNYGEVYGNI